MKRVNFKFRMMPQCENIICGLNNKFFNRLLLLGLAVMTMSVDAWGSYTITFKSSGTSDGTAAKTSKADLISAGGDYISSISASYAYVGQSGTGVKLGSSSKAGNVEMTMASSGTYIGQVKASSMSVSAKYYDSGKTLKVTVTYTDATTDETTITPTSSMASYAVTVSSTKTISKIKVASVTASKGRMYVGSVTVTTASSDTWTLAGFDDWSNPISLSDGKFTKVLEAKTYTYNTSAGFKLIKNGNTYYGCNSTMTRANTKDPWTFYSGDGNNNCGITADVAGTYTFALDASGSDPKLSVTYPETVDVTFSANGKSASGMPAKQTIAKGGKASEPASNPTATGWTFSGWYKEAGCTNQWNFATDVANSNTTIYAKWVEDLNTNWKLKGSFNSWGDANPFEKLTGQSTGSVAYTTVNLEANTNYTFKIQDGDTWYGNNNNTSGETYWIKGSVSDWEFKTSDGDCYMKSSVAGIYQFKIDYSGSNPLISVTYPTVYTVTLTTKEAGYGTFTPETTSYDVLSGTSILTNQSARTLTIGTTIITANAASQTTEYTYTFDNWSWTPSGSTITAATTATATFTRSARMYAVTKTLTNVTANPAIGTEVAYGGSISATISPAPGYALPESITVSGGTSSWSQSTGALSITNVTGAVSITIAGVQLVDKYVDNLHGNGTTEKTGSYEAPSLSDNSGGEGECQTGHSHFAGWSTTTSSTGVDDTSKVAGFFAAGTAKTATGATYYAVWAKAQ